MGEPINCRSRFLSGFSTHQQGRPGQVARGISAPNGLRDGEGRQRRGARGQRPDRCRRALRAPRQPVEPEDEAVHLRQAEPDPYHRLEGDRPRPAPRDQVLPAGRRGERADPVRRDQATGGRDDRRGMQPLPDALRDRALAGRHAHQLPDDPQPARAPGGAGDDPRRRAGAELLQEDDLDAHPRAQEDRAQPLRASAT